MVQELLRMKIRQHRCVRMRTRRSIGGLMTPSYGFARDARMTHSGYFLHRAQPPHSGLTMTIEAYHGHTPEFAVGADSVQDRAARRRESALSRKRRRAALA